MNNQKGFVAVPDVMRDSAGVMTWWELEGVAMVEDVNECLASYGFPESSHVAKPSLEMALSRAAAATLPSKRHLLRPLSKRGSWEIVLEKVVHDHMSRERLEYVRLATGMVDGGLAQVETYDVNELTLRGDQLRQAIMSRVDFYKGVLVPSDFSAWLLNRAEDLHATALRSRGGFYFIPRDRADEWAKLHSVVADASQHKIFEIPAMRTEEAIDAILNSIVMEAESEMMQIENYLRQDKVSTRGVNSATRTIKSVGDKVRHYSELFDRAMPEIEGRLEQLSGAVQAARVIEAGDQTAKYPGS